MPRTTRRLLALGALAVLAALALVPATSPAAQGPVRFTVTGIDIKGTIRSQLNTGDTGFTYEARARYAPRGRDHGTLVVPARAGGLASWVVEPVSYSGSGGLRIVEKTRRWDCPVTTNVNFLPNRLATTVTTTDTTIRIQWMLNPPPIRCDEQAPAWSFAGQPSAGVVNRYDLKRLRAVKRGARAGFIVRLDERWSDEDGTHHVRWDGVVRLQRAR